jgi:hypothetical protein
VTLRGIDAAVLALQARLASNLPAAIDTINTENTGVDDVTLAHPAHVLDYVPVMDDLQAFPTVGIALGRGKFQDDTGYEATGVYPISIVLFDQHSDHRWLARRIRRYNLALLRVVMQGRNLGTGTGIPWGVTLDGMDFGPMLRDNSNPAKPPYTYMTWTELTVLAKLDES